MEKLIDDHSSSALLAGLIIVFALHLIYRVGHFIWEINNKKHEVTDESIKNLTSLLASNMSAINSLEERIKRIDQTLSEFSK